MRSKSDCKSWAAALRLCPPWRGAVTSDGEQMDSQRAAGGGLGAPTLREIPSSGPNLEGGQWRGPSWRGAVEQGLSGVVGSELRVGGFTGLRHGGRRSERSIGPRATLKRATKERGRWSEGEHLLGYAGVWAPEKAAGRCSPLALERRSRSARRARRHTRAAPRANSCGLGGMRENASPTTPLPSVARNVSSRVPSAVTVAAPIVVGASKFSFLGAASSTSTSRCPRSRRRSVARLLGCTATGSSRPLLGRALLLTLALCGGLHLFGGLGRGGPGFRRA